MSAARRKGKWTGGHPVLGYDIDPRGGRLILNSREAEQVEMLYKLYLSYRSLRQVLCDIDRRGWRTKKWVTKSGGVLGGKPFTKSSLYRLLVNPIYTGNVDYRGHIYPGEHEAILESQIWEEVQAILHRRATTQ